LHGAQNETFSAKFVYNADGFQIGKPPSNTMRLFLYLPKCHFEIIKLAKIVEIEKLNFCEM
jgi:hypothetical protein